MWYCDPAWWATLVSLGALPISYRALLNSRRATRSSVEDRVAQLATNTNEAFATYGIKTPYAQSPGIPKKDSKLFAAKSALLFHQINLLRLVFDNRDVLGNKARQSYANWATTVLDPWINADKQLVAALSMVRQTEDTFSPGFLAWLREVLLSLSEPDSATHSTKERQ